MVCKTLRNIIIPKLLLKVFKTLELLSHAEENFSYIIGVLIGP